MVPLMTWRDEFEGRLNKVVVEPTEQNGLDNKSVADFLQVRGVSVRRLLRRLGRMDTALLDEIAAGIVIAVDYQP